jgi:holliday junction DNA helicase RuvA
MIAWLSGNIVATGTNFIVLNVNGVGYMVSMTQRALAQLDGVGTHVTVHVETQVREDAITLFGFYDTQEKEWFQRLTTVQGVGAKMALNLLSVLSPDMLLRAIMSDDKAALTQADGVGPKLAVRLLTELKEPAKKIFLNVASLPAVTPATIISKKADTAQPTSAQQNDALIREATSALVNLGYAPSDALQAVSKAVAQMDEPTLSALIKAGLQDMAA